MVPEFGYGSDGYGPNRLIKYGEALISEGCAKDYGTVPDPYMRISYYKCKGQTGEFKLKINKKKCRYFVGSKPRNDGSAFEKTVHQYQCYGVEVDLETKSLKQLVKG